MSYYVYKITNLTNNKLYIGKTRNLTERWQEHQIISKGGKEKYPRTYSAIHAAIVKYGEENFNFQKIEEYNLEQEALDREVYWIQKYKDDGYTLYNLTNGGDGISGHVHSEESRKKMSEIHRGEKAYNTNLTDEKVLQMKIHLARGATIAEVSLKFGVAFGTVLDISSRSWKHIQIPENIEKVRKLPPNSKLNEEQVRGIKMMLMEDKHTYVHIARQYGCSPKTVSLIDRGKQWKWIQI